jgi:UDP-GlcNAc:undecaprenyl-phosphate GlcNAc-1-phosphate transferase
LTSALALLATYLAVPAFLELLQRGGAVRANHQQQQVPVGGGFLFVWMGSLAAALAGQLGPGRQLATGPGAAGMPVILFTAAALGYSLLGLFDDLVGTRKQTGLLGHGRALLQGHLTSGAVKALAGGIFGFVLAVYRLPVKGLGAAPTEAGLFRSAVDGLLIAASANTLNLFDLRPGRAGKAFLAGWALMLLGGSPVSTALLPWVGSFLGYFSFDLRGEVMMGDAGSNSLGALLGLAACYALALPFRLVLLAFLILLHLLAERISFSQVIDNHWILHRLDSWGRREP